MHILDLSAPGLLLSSAFHFPHSARPCALRLRLCGSGFTACQNYGFHPLPPLLSFACLFRYPSLLTTT